MIFANLQYHNDETEKTGYMVRMGLNICTSAHILMLCGFLYRGATQSILTGNITNCLVHHGPGHEGSTAGD